MIISKHYSQNSNTCLSFHIHSISATSDGVVDVGQVGKLCREAGAEAKTCTFDSIGDALKKEKAGTSLDYEAFTKVISMSH